MRKVIANPLFIWYEIIIYILIIISFPDHNLTVYQLSLQQGIKWSFITTKPLTTAEITYIMNKNKFYLLKLISSFIIYQKKTVMKYHVRFIKFN